MRFSRIFCLGHTLLALYVGWGRVSFNDSTFFLLVAVDLPIALVLHGMGFTELRTGNKTSSG